jgi:hypothetical protein
MKSPNIIPLLQLVKNPLAEKIAQHSGLCHDWPAANFVC